MDETTEFGIVEMGANHPGEIKTLCEIADPDFGIITNIGHAHWKVSVATKILSPPKSPLRLSFTEKRTSICQYRDPLLMQLSRDHKRYTYGQEGDYSKVKSKNRPLSGSFAGKTRKEGIYMSKPTQ